MVVMDIDKMAGAAGEVSDDSFENILTKMRFDMQHLVQILIQIEQDVHKSRLIATMFNTTAVQRAHYLSNNLVKVQQDLCKETHTTTRISFELHTAQEKIELYMMQADDHKCKTLEQQQKIEDLSIRLVESEKNLRKLRVDLKSEMKKRIVVEEDNKQLKVEISVLNPGDTALMIQNTHLFKRIEELESHNVKIDAVKTNLMNEMKDLRNKHERLVDESMQGIYILSAQHAEEKKEMQREIESLKNNLKEIQTSRDYFMRANSDLETDFKKYKSVSAFSNMAVKYKSFMDKKKFTVELVKEKLVVRKELWVFFEEWKILYAKSADEVEFAARTTVSTAINNCYANNILGMNVKTFFDYDELSHANALPVLICLRHFFLNTTHYHVQNMVQGLGIFVTPEVLWDVVNTFYNAELESEWIGMDGQADKFLCASDVLIMCRKASLLSYEEANYKDPLKSGRLMRKLARVLYEKTCIN